jgi:hypothetical protein
MINMDQVEKDAIAFVLRIDAERAKLEPPPPPPKPTIEVTRFTETEPARIDQQSVTIVQNPNSNS